MDDLTVAAKSKKRVTFGKARVRLVFDYYDDECREDEDTDEKTSREISKMKEKLPQLQKQPKSILKPKMKTVSVDSGLNVLQRLPKRIFEWEKMDKNFWEPAKHKQTEKTRRRSQSDSIVSTSQNKTLSADHKRSKDKDESRMSKEIKKLSKNNQKTKISAKESTADVITSQNRDTRTKNATTLEDNNFCEDEKNMASAEDETSSREKQAIKDNEKWQGGESHATKGLKTFVGIYSGVEADWDQTRQSLSRIGVNVGKDKLQNPREFVTIMNKLLNLKKEKPETQQVNIPDHDEGIQQNETKILGEAQKDSSCDPNSSCRTEVEPKSFPEISDLEPSEQTMATIDEITNTKQNKKHENEKRAATKEELKKRIKKLKMKGLIPGKKDHAKSKTRKRSCSEDNLSHSSRSDGQVIDYENHSSFDSFRCRMLKNGSKFEEKRRYRKRSCSENNLEFFNKFECEKTRKKHESGSMEGVNFDTEVECSGMDNDVHKGNWYSDNSLDFPRNASMDDSAVRGRSSSYTKESGLSAEDSLHKKNLERPKVVKRDSWFLIRKQKMMSESDQKTAEIKSKKRKDKIEKEKSGFDSERRRKIHEDIAQRKVEVQESSTSGSDLDNQRRNVKRKDCQENSHVSRSQATLLMIANHSGSEREDSEIGTSNDSGLSGVSDEVTYEKRSEGKDTSSAVERLDKCTKSKAMTKPGHFSQLEESKQSQKTNEASTMVEANEVLKTTKVPETSDTYEQLPQAVGHSQCDDMVQLSPGQPCLSSVANTHQRAVETRLLQAVENKGTVEDVCKVREDCPDESKRNDQSSSDEQVFLDRQFEEDMCFINVEASKCMKSIKYIEKSRNKYLLPTRKTCFPEKLKTNLALKVMGAINMNPATEILLPFSH